MDQCEDRAYRSGQHNNVLCNYFLAKNTIDEWIYELNESKRAMGNAITGSEDNADVSIIEGIMNLFG